MKYVDIELYNKNKKGLKRSIKYGMKDTNYFDQYRLQNYVLGQWPFCAYAK